MFKTSGQDGEVVDTLHLLTQPQRDLQLNLKTDNTQNCQKTKPYGSPTTKDLKKPSRWVGEADSLKWA